MKTIDIVLTAVNKEALPHILASIPVKELEEKDYKVGIIISDGTSASTIAEIARTVDAAVIHSPQGCGRQYKHVFSKSQADIIIAMDADGSYPASLIPELVTALENEGLDFASINRMWKQEKGAMPFIEKAANFVLNMTASILFDIYIIDSQSTMWAFKRPILANMKLHANGSAFTEEFLIEAISNFLCREIPGTYKKRIGKGQLCHFCDSLGNLLFLFRKRLNLF